MKKSKRHLKNFPAKSLGSKIKEKNEVDDAQKILEPLSVKLEKIETVVQNMINFDDKSDSKKGEFDNILGELLSYLRGQRLMMTLMACRKIENIEVQDGVAILKADSDDLQELSRNEKHTANLTSFFKSKGLSFKISEKIKTDSVVEKLKEFFGDKLIVK